MGMSAEDRRVAELRALIKRHFRRMKQLEKRRKDLTSAQIVADSLSLSLLLAVQAQARCAGVPDEIQMDASGTSMSRNPVPFVIVPRGAPQNDLAIRPETPMTDEEDDFLNLADKIGIKGMLDNAFIIPEIEDRQKKDLSAGHFEFRPLTEEQKKDFLHSLDEGQPTLAERSNRAKNSDDHTEHIAETEHNAHRSPRRPRSFSQA